MKSIRFVVILGMVLGFSVSSCNARAEVNSGHHPTRCQLLLTSLMNFYDQESHVRESKPQFAEGRETATTYKFNTAQRQGRVFKENDLYNNEKDDLFDKKSDVCTICEGNLSNYAARTETITSLRENDQIILDNEEVLTLGQYLGAGNSAHVFAIKNKPHLAVRIPRGASPVPIERLKWAMRMRDFYVRSSEMAKELGIPIIKIVHVSTSLVIVERLSPFETAQDLAERLSHQVMLTVNDIEKLQGLGRFLKLLRGKPFLADLTVDQLAWHPARQEWIAFDWTNVGDTYPASTQTWVPEYELMFSHMWRIFGQNWGIVADQMGELNFDRRKSQIHH